MSEGNGNGYSKEALPKSLPLPETSVKMAMLASPEGNITPCLSQPQPSFVEDSIPGNPPETSSLVVNTTQVEVSETTPEQKPHETLSLPLQPDPDEKPEEKTFRLPVVPVVKTPDINLDVRKVKIRPPPSPKIKANKGLGEEKSLIAWSKDYLKSYKANVGVITNLTTSWRSGLAFCALLHKKFPELIPFKELTKAQDPEDNVMIAFQAGELIGVDFGSVSQDGFRANPDKATVVNLLKAFQACLDQPVDSIPEPDSVRLLDFQVGWFKKKGYFEKRVGDLVRKQEEDRLRVEAEAKAEYEAKVAEEEAKEREERERALKQQKELEREAQRKKLYENGQEASPVNQPDRSKHKDRIEAMIEEAHKYEEVSGAEELDKDEVIQVQADAGGQAKLIIPASTTPENGEDIESSSTSSSATEDNDGVVEPEEEVGQFHPSNTIMESLNQLEDEEVRVRKNKEELQEILAEEEDNKFMLEQTQKKYISCVNKLNSIEQQKNQLNFDMERQKINHEIKMVDAKLRKLCSIDDSRITEAMRDEERLLNEKLEELMKDLVQLEVKKNMDATEAEEMAQSLNEMGQAFERGSNSYSSLPVRSQGGGGYQPSGTLKKLFFR